MSSSSSWTEKGLACFSGFRNWTSWLCEVWSSPTTSAKTFAMPWKLSCMCMISRSFLIVLMGVVFLSTTNKSKRLLEFFSPAGEWPVPERSPQSLSAHTVHGGGSDCDWSTSSCAHIVTLPCGRLTKPRLIKRGCQSVKNTRDRHDLS